MTSTRKPFNLPGWLAWFGGICSGLLMFALVCITFVDVIGRQIGYPLSFAFEFTQMTVGLMFYVTLPLVTLRREHIVVDFIPFREGSLTDVFSMMLVNLLSTFILAGATYQLWHQGNALQMYNTVLMFTRWPVAPIVYFMSAMAAVTTLILLALSIVNARQTIDILRGGR